MGKDERKEMWHKVGPSEEWLLVLQFFLSSFCILISERVPNENIWALGENS